MRIITLCGSLKFQEQMMEATQKLSIEGNCVLTPVYPTSHNSKITEKELEQLKEVHFKKIEMSDAILVIDVNNYIGKSTSLEIEYANKLGKEIIYYSDLVK